MRTATREVKRDRNESDNDNAFKITHLEHTFKSPTIHPIEIQNIIENLAHHAQATLKRLELNLLGLCYRAKRFHILYRQERSIQRHPHFMEYI